MTHNIASTARAMTAIAAALALTSTASFAQDATTAPGTSAETAAAPDPLAPEPAAKESSTTTEAAPPPAPKPKVETRTTAAKTTAAKPVKASAPAPRPAARRASAAAAPPAPIAAPTPAPAETAAAAPLPAEPLPTAAEPAPPPVAEPAPAGGMAGALMAEIMADDRLPYAGGAALGLLALGGAGLVSRRRKRRRENEAFETRQQFLDQAKDEGQGEAEPPVLELDRSAEVRAGPAFARPAPIHDPVPAQKAAIAGAPATQVPEGFDLSRFGRHVQAAYRGPTADNPSLSLKYRLRRGAAFDQQERMAAEQAGLKPEATPAASIPASIPVRGNWEARPDANYLFRRAAKPAEQREVEHH